MENKKFDRPYMASYPLGWFADSEARAVEAEELAGLTDSEIEKVFWDEYNAQRGMTPPQVPDFGIDLQHIPGIA